MYFELTPAYGRDYKTKAEVVSAFNQGADFEGDLQLGFRLCSKRDIPTGSTVLLRYRRQTRVTSLKVTGGVA